MDELIAGGRPTYDIPVKLTVQELTRITWAGSAIRNAFLCLLASRRPLHLGNNAPLDLVSGSISDLTSNEKHHIFPRAFLQRSGPDHAEPHWRLSELLLPARGSQSTDPRRGPRHLLRRVEGPEPRFRGGRPSQLIPFGPGSGVPENDYLAFLKARGELIRAEVARLCGDITTPREEERQVARGGPRTADSDLIHEVLTRHVGASYWTRSIPPEHPRGRRSPDPAGSRTASDLRPEQFRLNRRRLDYLNVMDYRTIIENGANWADFEPIFRRKQDLQGHLEHFSEFRNGIMHGRPMGELAQSAGETAMLWLESVLPDEVPVEIGEDVEDE